MSNSPDWEDVGEFLDVSEFGSVATLQLEGLPVELVGIFDASYSEPNLGGFEAVSSRPRFTVDTSTVPAGVVRGVEFAHAAREYKVHSVEPDGTGITVLELAEV